MEGMKGNNAECLSNPQETLKREKGIKMMGQIESESCGHQCNLKCIHHYIKGK